MPLPELSVVMPTFNRLSRIRRVLDALARQDYSRDAVEIVVVSDGSTDGTNEYLTSLSYPGRLRTIIQSNKGPAAARNNGVSTAQGTFIVFIDDDVVPEPNLLTEHMRVHSGCSRDAAVIGPLLTPRDIRLSPWVQWEQDMLVKQYDAMTRGDWAPTARQFYTGNASVRRDLILAAGGFDENFRRAEDIELAYRLADRGVDFIFSTAAIGLHYADRSFKSWSDAAYSYGRNDAVFARDRKQGWLLPTIRKEFGDRKLPLRMMLKACLGRPQLSALAEFGMVGWAGLAGRLSMARIEGAAYSGLFGLRYYQGFLDEIEQPDFFTREPAPRRD